MKNYNKAVEEEKNRADLLEKGVEEQKNDTNLQKKVVEDGKEKANLTAEASNVVNDDEFNDEVDDEVVSIRKDLSKKERDKP